MLVLARKTGEAVGVGDNIRVVVIEIRYKQVRLGFIAPNDVRILREELVDIENSSLASDVAIESELIDHG